MTGKRLRLAAVDSSTGCGGGPASSSPGAGPHRSVPPLTSPVPPGRTPVVLRVPSPPAVPRRPLPATRAVCRPPRPLLPDAPERGRVSDGRKPPGPFREETHNARTVRPPEEPEEPEDLPTCGEDVRRGRAAGPGGEAGPARAGTSSGTGLRVRVRARAGAGLRVRLQVLARARTRARHATVRARGPGTHRASRALHGTPRFQAAGPSGRHPPVIAPPYRRPPRRQPSRPPRAITSAYQRALSFSVRRWDAKSTCTMPNRLL